MRATFKHLFTMLVSVLVFSVMVMPVNASNIDNLPAQPGDVTPEALTSQSGEAQLLAAPTITVWYEGSLNFGGLGNPLEFVNILGRVGGSNIKSLTYRLNGGSAVSLDIGGQSSNPRLEYNGDFNASLPVSSLNNGTNTIVFTATNTSDEVTTKTVNFTYTPNKIWPIPYNTNWSGSSNIHARGQVVDGLWTKTSGGVYMSPSNQGYDRLIAIGNINWSSYEILVPITIHSFHPVGTDGGGVGIIARFQGHYGSGSPPVEWDRLGAYAYYSNRVEALALRLDGTSPAERDFNFQFDVTYMFKLRAETVGGNQGRYSFKVWRQGENEPTWGAPGQFVNVIDGTEQVLQGSVLLVAHRASATFGDVQICQLGGEECQVMAPPNNPMFIPLIRK